MTQPASFLYLSRQALEDLGITTAQAVDSLERLIRARVDSKAWAAPKAVIQPPDGRYMMATLTAADDPPLLATKSVILNPRNTERGYPQINGLITLLDSETGFPVAVVDGNWVTGVRTAAASAIAARRLARPDSRVMGFVGCGVQARNHLKLFSDLFPLKDIRVFGRGAANREALCQMAMDMGLKASDCETARSAVEDADIVVTSVTLATGTKPFIDAHWLKPGVFVSSTDLAIPWIPESMDMFERIVIDDLEQEASMQTPLVDPALVKGDLGGLVTGTVDQRQTKEERTAFVFRAVALGDLALAGLAWQQARDISKGQEIFSRE